MSELEIKHPEDILNISDEDVMKMTEEPTIVENPDDPNKEAENDTEETTDSDDAGTTEGTDDDTAEGQESTEEDSEAEDDEEDADSDDDEIDEDAVDDAETSKEDIDKPVAKKAKGKKGKKEVTTEEVSLKSSDDLLKELFTPFKANGKEMQINSIDDARILMQMGANYNKKMAGLKPNLKLIKMLDNNKLLNEEKLSYLIDLSNKNPEAIAKLIKDSGIDPVDIDTEDSTEYKPNTYTVKDKEVDLDQVLLDIEGTPSFKQTIDIIGTKWDDSSKKVLLDTPQLITTINDHVASGIYDQIASIIEQERTLGRLTELSDLEAYKHVGEVLNANGAFNRATPDADKAPITKTVKAKEDPKLKDRRRAAGGTKNTPKGKPKVINPLFLSDEDFEKAAAPI